MPDWLNWEALLIIKKFLKTKIQKKYSILLKKFLDFNTQQKGKGLKILTPKQILQRLPISLAQVKAGNTSENLLNEIRQIMYSLYQAKKITKELYSNIMNSIKI